MVDQELIQYQLAMSKIDLIGHRKFRRYSKRRRLGRYTTMPIQIYNTGTVLKNGEMQR
jgi:hypothetical protein